MSSEEAIKMLQNEVACVKAGVCSLRCTKCKLFVTDEQVLIAHEMAISALRAQQQAEANEPLTLDELRQMNVEPVWFVHEEHGRWRIMDVIRGAAREEFILFDGELSDWMADYGKTWLAYRHKPKEA